MEQFIPKHFGWCNCTESEDGYVILLSEYGNIIVSNCLKDKIIPNYEGASEYIILKDNNIIQYSDLILITNALSVINTKNFLLFLLMDAYLIYIIKSESFVCKVKVLNDKIKSKYIQYISEGNHDIIFTFVVDANVLMCLSPKFEIIIIRDSIGYIYHDSKLLTINKHNIINSHQAYMHSQHKLYRKFDKFEDTCTPTYAILYGVDATELKYIHTSEHTIVAIFKNGNIMYYTTLSDNKIFYDKIKNLNNIKRIELTNKYLICLLDAKRFLLSKYNNSLDSKIFTDFVEYFNVDEYVVGNSFILIKYASGSMEKVCNYGHITIDFEITDNKIYKIFFSGIGRFYYITTDNKIKIYCKFTNNNIHLNIFFDIDHLTGYACKKLTECADESAIKELNLKDYFVCSYI